MFLHLHMGKSSERKKKNRGVEVGFHCFSYTYFSNAQFFLYPGRTDTAVPTSWGEAKFLGLRKILSSRH